MATIAYDLKIDTDGDIYIDPIAMDFVIAPSDNQHIADILSSAPGNFKKFPLLGWNPYSRLNSKNNSIQNNQDAKIQLQSDGYIVPAGGIDIELSANGQIFLNKLDVTRG